ncbi:unnamed protein product [Rotaria sordida]|uniref:Hexosyltransferase n=1 Tax=Rotaria sordida TaxID=392033 RepID=A0A815JX27_9BILA|nr:unnamed protein product [Rotaria sordida]CAF1248496.1 unnamed protein product [Rotaria sordida]CAF1385646.1 unnamed protein product [Rotaria sordida]
MFYKYNYMKKNSIMFFTKICISYILQRFRTLSLLKLIILIIIIFLFSIYILFFNKNHQLCDPAEQLSWFCPWPDPQTTVCTWDDHFPTITERVRSPESYEEFFSSLPRIQNPFEYNNLTLIECHEPSIDILIFVISKCSHASIRQSIRRTWGNTKLLKKYFPNIELKLLFLVDIDSKSEKKIELEYKYHKDIVQVNNLPEQYEYVTEREAALYEFIKLHCKQTKFIFKTDDDIFINTFLLLLLLSSKNNFQYLTNNKTIYSLFGFPIEYGLVVRHGIDQIGQRYVITQDEYSCSRYPTFLSGFGYLMSFKTCSLLINAYQTDSKPFPLSDVYFTGLLPQMMNIQRQTIFQNVDYRYQTKCSEEFFASENNPLACAASTDHFNGKESNGYKSFMNDYNLYWTKLRKQYDSLRTNHRD